ncbi:hypothetical protein DOY81_010641, partial [Sarcophaga bullata]
YLELKSTTMQSRTKNKMFKLFLKEDIQVNQFQLIISYALLITKIK